MPNKWTNLEKLNLYLNGLDKNYSYFNNRIKNIFKIDTTNKDKINVAFNVCNKIIDNLNENGV